MQRWLPFPQRTNLLRGCRALHRHASWASSRCASISAFCHGDSATSSPPERSTRMLFVEQEFAQRFADLPTSLDIAPVRRPLLEGALSAPLSEDVTVTVVSGVCGDASDDVKTAVYAQALQLADTIEASCTSMSLGGLLRHTLLTSPAGETLLAMLPELDCRARVVLRVVEEHDANEWSDQSSPLSAHSQPRPFADCPVACTLRLSDAWHTEPQEEVIWRDDQSTVRDLESLLLRAAEGLVRFLRQRRGQYVRKSLQEVSLVVEEQGEKADVLDDYLASRIRNGGRLHSSGTTKPAWSATVTCASLRETCQPLWLRCTVVDTYENVLAYVSLPFAPVSAPTAFVAEERVWLLDDTACAERAASALTHTELQKLLQRSSSGNNDMGTVRHDDWDGMPMDSLSRVMRVIRHASPSLMRHCSRGDDEGGRDGERHRSPDGHACALDDGLVRWCTFSGRSVLNDWVADYHHTVTRGIATTTSSAVVPPQLARLPPLLPCVMQPKSRLRYLYQLLAMEIGRREVPRIDVEGVFAFPSLLATHPRSGVLYALGTSFTTVDSALSTVAPWLPSALAAVTSSAHEGRAPPRPTSRSDASGSLMTQQAGETKGPYSLPSPRPRSSEGVVLELLHVARCLRLRGVVSTTYVASRQQLQCFTSDGEKKYVFDRIGTVSGLRRLLSFCASVHNDRSGSCVYCHARLFPGTTHVQRVWLRLLNVMMTDPLSADTASAAAKAQRMPAPWSEPHLLFLVPQVNAGGGWDTPECVRIPVRSWVRASALQHDMLAAIQERSGTPHSWSALPSRPVCALERIAPLARLLRQQRVEHPECDYHFERDSETNPASHPAYTLVVTPSPTADAATARRYAIRANGPGFLDDCYHAFHDQLPAQRRALPVEARSVVMEWLYAFFNVIEPTTKLSAKYLLRGLFRCNAVVEKTTGGQGEEAAPTEGHTCSLLLDVTPDITVCLATIATPGHTTNPTSGSLHEELLSAFLAASCDAAPRLLTALRDVRQLLCETLGSTNEAGTTTTVLHQCCFREEWLSDEQTEPVCHAEIIAKRMPDGGSMCLFHGVGATRLEALTSVVSQVRHTAPPHAVQRSPVAAVEAVSSATTATVGALNVPPSELQPAPFLRSFAHEVANKLYRLEGHETPTERWSVWHRYDAELGQLQLVKVRHTMESPSHPSQLAAYEWCTAAGGKLPPPPPPLQSPLYEVLATETCTWDDIPRFLRPLYNRVLTPTIVAAPDEEPLPFNTLQSRVWKVLGIRQGLLKPHFSEYHHIVKDGMANPPSLWCSRLCLPCELFGLTAPTTRGVAAPESPESDVSRGDGAVPSSLKSPHPSEPAVSTPSTEPPSCCVCEAYAASKKEATRHLWRNLYMWLCQDAPHHPLGLLPRTSDEAEPKDPLPSSHTPPARVPRTNTANGARSVVSRAFMEPWRMNDRPLSATTGHHDDGERGPRERVHTSVPAPRRVVKARSVKRTETAVLPALLSVVQNTLPTAVRALSGHVELRLSHTFGLELRYALAAGTSLGGRDVVRLRTEPWQRSELCAVHQIVHFLYEAALSLALSTEAPKDANTAMPPARHKEVLRNTLLSSVAPEGAATPPGGTDSLLPAVEGRAQWEDSSIDKVFCTTLLHLLCGCPVLDGTHGPDGEAADVQRRAAAHAAVFYLRCGVTGSTKQLTAHTGRTAASSLAASTVFTASIRLEQWDAAHQRVGFAKLLAESSAHSTSAAVDGAWRMLYEDLRHTFRLSDEALRSNPTRRLLVSRLLSQLEGGLI